MESQKRFKSRRVGIVFNVFSIAIGFHYDPILKRLMIGIPFVAVYFYFGCFYE